MSPTWFFAASVVLLCGPPVQSGGGTPRSATADRQPRLVAQLGHAGPIHAVAFSPDGQLLLTGSQDSTAVLWHAATGRALRGFVGHLGMLRDVAFSADGRYVLTASWDKTARLWDAATGESVRVFEGHALPVKAVDISPDGRQVLTGSLDNTVRLWDTATGRQVRQFEEHPDSVEAAAFSPDGRYALTGCHDRKARWWDVATGRKLREYAGHTDRVMAVAVSPDGRQVLTGSWDATARLWDQDSGRVLRVFTGHTKAVVSVAFSPDGRRVLTASADLTARLWDATTGKQLQRFEGPASWVASAAFSPDGRIVAGGSGDGTLYMWDADSGRMLQQCAGICDSVTATAISADGRLLVTGKSNNRALLWDATAGSLRFALQGHSAAVTSVALSPDGRQVLTGSADRTARLWDSGTGRQTRTFAGHTQPIVAVAFSHDGHRVLTGGADGDAKQWDVSADEPLRSLPGRVSAVAFSPDGRRVLTGSTTDRARLWDADTGRVLKEFLVCGHAVAFSPDGRQVLTDDFAGTTARLWDAATGAEVRRFEGHTGWVGAVAFSADGRYVATGSADKTARIWEVSTGRARQILAGHAAMLGAVAFAPDGKQLLTGGRDNTARLWDAGTGNELCRLIGFGAGEWAVIDRAGRFDASHAGEVDGLHWVLGNEPVALHQLKERYYEPRLLAKVAGFDPEPLRDVHVFADVGLFPAVQLTPPTAAAPTLGIRLTNRGGGIGRVVVQVNGKELTADARRPGTQFDAAQVELQVDLSEDPRLVPGQPNTIEVHAFNAEGYLCSRGLRALYTPGPKTLSAPANLWGLVAGISDYRGEALDLSYAAKDAEDFARALRIAAERLFGAENVHIITLTGSQADLERRATRAALTAAFARVRQAQPTDVLVVYLAGHGVNYGGQDGDYYFQTSDAQSADLTDAALRQQVALSSSDLTELIKQIPALRQVLILDTCAAGRLVEKLTERRSVPASQTRALERVKDRTGMYVLAGCAADRVSYEASCYGQGLLTYSLLLGLRGAALRDDEYADVSKLFDFAADHVPELAREIGGIQRPLLASPKGGAPFDIGRLTSADKAQIPVATVHPLVLRASFQDEVRVRDHLNLTRQVNALLRDRSTRGRDAKLVFVDAAEFPGACELVGRYRVADGLVTVTALLSQGDAVLARFEVSGKSDAIQDLAARLVDEAEKRLLATTVPERSGRFDGLVPSPRSGTGNNRPPGAREEPSATKIESFWDLADSSRSAANCARNCFTSRPPMSSARGPTTIAYRLKLRHISEQARNQEPLDHFDPLP